MPTLTRLLLASACVLIAPLVVMADELPKDTNKITSLTVEEAKRLVAQHNAEFKGQVLALDGLTTLTPEAAATLAASKKWTGQLPGLTGFEAADSVAGGGQGTPDRAKKSVHICVQSKAAATRSDSHEV